MIEESRFNFRVPSNLSDNVNLTIRIKVHFNLNDKLISITYTSFIFMSVPSASLFICNENQVKRKVSLLDKTNTKFLHINEGQLVTGQ